MQSGFHTVDDQGMASVVAALKTHHAGGGFGQPIDQLSFAFVTPLGADDDDVTAFGGGHGLSLGSTHIDSITQKN
jgi:hypothetical protein